MYGKIVKMMPNDYYIDDEGPMACQVGFIHFLCVLHVCGLCLAKKGMHIICMST